MWDVMKGIIGNKRVTNVLLSNFITVKNREIFDKKEIAEAFNKLNESKSKTKRHFKNIFTTKALVSVPLILRT